MCIPLSSSGPKVERWIGRPCYRHLLQRERDFISSCHYFSHFYISLVCLPLRTTEGKICIMAVEHTKFTNGISAPGPAITITVANQIHFDDESCTAIWRMPQPFLWSLIYHTLFVVIYRIVFNQEHGL